MFANLLSSFRLPKLGSIRILRPALMLSVIPLAPAPAVAQTPFALDHELTRLSEEWMRAVWDKDDAALNRLMTDDFVLISPGGSNKRQSRPEWSRTARLAGNGECSYSNVSVQSLGDLAIMAAELKCKGDFHGIGLDADSVVSDVWVKRQGRWLVASRIASTSPRFRGIWMPLLMGASLPLVAWAWFGFRSRYRERNSLLSSANRF